MAGKGSKSELLLFIHGLGGSSNSTWGKFHTLLQADNEISPRCEIAYFDFPTALITIPFGIKPLKIQELANALKTEISLRHHAYSRIVIVAHSLGGLIAQRYIIDLENYRLPNKITDVILFGTPNYGSWLARIGIALSFTNWQTFQLTPHSEIITQISEDWLRLECDARFRALYVVGGQDSIVERSSSSRVRGVSVETIANKGHIDLVKPDKADDLSFLIVKRAVLRESYGANYRATEISVSGVKNVKQSAAVQRSKSLFERYTADVEEFYIARREDLLLNEYIKFRHIWIWGPSGFGKTSALLRATILGGFKAKFASLGHYDGGNAKEVFRGLIAELVINLPNTTPENLGWPQMIDKAVALVKENAELGVTHFLVEEIPLEVGESYDTFISKINLMMIRISQAHDLKITFLFSSIADPSRQIFAIPKMAELSKVICFNRWRSFDVDDLVSRISNDTGAQLNHAQKLELKRQANNSPRMIKLFYLSYNFLSICGGSFEDALIDVFGEER